VKVPIEESCRETGKGPVSTKWLDASKGDTVHPNIRSRFVAREIAHERDSAMFAATPPLEANKLLYSLATTEGVGYNEGDREGGMCLMFIDIKRAFFNAQARRPVYVQLPPEDEEEGMCGRLLKSLYGTRDAARNWEEEYSGYLESIGFIRGISTPSVFYHETRELRVVVHGDDFTFLGWKEQLNWVRAEMMKRYEIKFELMGPAAGDNKSVRILNRVLQWRESGLELEADQRHAELIIKYAGLGNKAKPVGSPGEKKPFEDREESPDLDREESRRYRAIVARANYLSTERSDIQYSVKELSRYMATPKMRDWPLVKRVARYLLGRPRAVLQYAYQHSQNCINTWTDTDVAGCRNERKSTSGGLMMHGTHCLKCGVLHRVL